MDIFTTFTGSTAGISALVVLFAMVVKNLGGVWERGVIIVSLVIGGVYLAKTLNVQHTQRIKYAQMKSQERNSTWNKVTGIFD